MTKALCNASQRKDRTQAKKRESARHPTIEGFHGKKGTLKENNDQNRRHYRRANDGQGYHTCLHRAVGNNEVDTEAVAKEMDSKMVSAVTTQQEAKQKPMAR